METELRRLRLGDFDFALSSHGKNGLSMNLDAVDAVGGLHVEHLSIGIAEDPLDGSCNHSMTMWISEDDHPAPHDWIADEISRVPATNIHRGMLSRLISDFSGGYTYHCTGVVYLQV